jgi:hypothetical protein
MAFAATYQAVRVAVEKKVFACHKNKVDAIVEGEYGFSRALLAANMNLDTLLLKYASGFDWRVEAEGRWNCNGNLHPTRHLTYLTGSGHRMTVHPMETVFYKPVWVFDNTVLSKAYVEETWAYLEWSLGHRKSESTSSV